MWYLSAVPLRATISYGCDHYLQCPLTATIPCSCDIYLLCPSIATILCDCDIYTYLQCSPTATVPVMKLRKWEQRGIPSLASRNVFWILTWLRQRSSRYTDSDFIRTYCGTCGHWRFRHVIGSAAVYSKYFFSQILYSGITNRNNSFVWLGIGVWIVHSQSNIPL